MSIARGLMWVKVRATSGRDPVMPPAQAPAATFEWNRVSIRQ